MGTGWLKSAVINSNKPKESIIQVLRKQIGGYEEGRSREILHASEVTKPYFCPREEALLDIQGVKVGKGMYIPTALRVTFDMGNAMAKALLEEWVPDSVVGNWNCRRCGAQRTMTGKPKPGCTKHEDCIWEYEEVRVMSEQCGASGGIDMLFSAGTPKLLVTELKTINPDEFEKIVAPLPEHRLRTALYLKLWAESNSPYKDQINLHEGRVLYCSRGYGKKNLDFDGEILPFKEYVVKRDDDSLSPILKKATQLKVFRDEGKMPAGICNTALDKAAKQCSSCVACFSGKHPAMQEPL